MRARACRVLLGRHAQCGPRRVGSAAKRAHSAVETAIPVALVVDFRALQAASRECRARDSNGACAGSCAWRCWTILAKPTRVARCWWPLREVLSGSRAALNPRISRSARAPRLPDQPAIRPLRLGLSQSNRLDRGNI